MFIQKNFDGVLSEISNGNNLKEKITVVGATKTVDVETINQAISKGLKVVAENKVQEFREKTEKIVGGEQHFIGHIQTNKVKYLVGKVALIHSVHDIELAKCISEYATKHGLVQDVLLEINVGKEESKSGFFIEDIFDAVKIIKNFGGVRIKGLMAMLPKSDDKDYLKKLCLQMREIFDKLKQEDENFIYLSMGMSADYKITIQNGSNMIRLGSLLFGERN